MCIYVADTFGCAAETNNIVKHQYFNSKERNQPPGTAQSRGDFYQGCEDQKTGSLGDHLRDCYTILTTVEEI